jgi:hypothetical protein
MLRIICRIGLALLFAQVTLATTSASANVVSSSASAGPSFDLPGGEVLLTFDEIVLPSNASITDEYEAYGVVFANSFFDVQGWDLPTGRHISNISPTVNHPYLEITFHDPVAEASFLVITNRENIYSGPFGRTVFQSFREGEMVSEFIGETDLTQREFGFSGHTFDQVRVYPGGWGNVARLDNLRFSPVPEPGSAGLLLGAVACLGWRMRNRIR